MKTSTALVRCAVVGLTLASLATNPTSVAAQERRTTLQDPATLHESAWEPRGFIAEPGTIERAVIWFDRHFGNDLTNGFYTDFWNMVPGAGWISGGPGYAKDSVFFDASAGVSWRNYKSAQALVEFPKLAGSRLTLGSQVKWQDLTQVQYFGEGPGALESNLSEYRVKSANLVGYGVFRPVRSVGIGGEVGWLKPSILPRGGSFQRDHPDTFEVFPSDVVFSRADQPTFLTSEASITADTRDFPGHPTRGSVLRAAATHYSDRDFGTFSFRQYDAEAAHFIPLVGSRVVVALHGWVVGSDTGEGQTVPFYLQPSLGGGNSLRAYSDYRFHDRSLLLVTAETRVAMMTHVDAAFFVDAGNVAPRVGDLNLDKRAYGFGLRLHSRRDTFARLDMARGDEGWRMTFRLTDPFLLKRISRRTAPVPFVP
jgi:hypothetical protein